MISVTRSTLILLVSLLSIITFAVSDASAEMQSEDPGTLRVIMDDNYPPYIFKDSAGRLKGILPDQWRLWEMKTGIRVELNATDWGEAKQRMEAGEFDVIDTIFRNEKRELIYDFTKPYSRIDVPLFFRSTIAGINNVSDLKGFSVAVKSGDNAIEVLHSHGITTLMEFNSYEAIVSAARDGKVNVFTVDEPPANYFLYKFGMNDQFRKTKPMYSGEFHRAVQKGNHMLLDMVENGFSQISTAEYEEIERRWYGAPILSETRLRYIRTGAVVVMAILAGMTLWLWMLKKLVAQRTKDLQGEIRKRIDKEKCLQESEAYLRTLIETIPDLIWLKDPKGVYLACNLKFERFFGAKQADIVGKTDYDFINNELADSFREKDKVAMAAGKPSLNEEEITYADDGHREMLETIKTPMFDHDKNLIGVLGIARDITERKNMATRLQQAIKLEAIGRLAGGVAHDLNNILSGIVSYPDLLLMQLPEKSELRQPIEVMQESGRRASEVVADLLTVARGVAGTRTISNLNTLIDKYISSPEHENLKAINDNVEFNVELEPELLNLSCSPVHIIKCVMNLVTNAVESVSGDGCISVSTHNRYLEQPIVENQYMAKGEYVVLKVADTGAGISEGDLKLVFEPFYTRKKMGRSGTGLGLYIVWNTVQDHHGGILVDSGNSGTTIEIYFPATREKLVAKSESIQLETLKGNGEIILIVDDEQLQIDIAGQMLKSLGYSVIAVRSGEEAIKYLNETTVDLVLLDMLMAPGINGRKTYEEIIKKHPRQKVIIVSGFSEDEDVKAAIQLGANGFIQKPYRMSTIGSSVKELINGKSN